MKIVKEKRGITLIALAVTIIVILILAGVTIDAVFSENGIINKSKEAANTLTITFSEWYYNMESKNYLYPIYYEMYHQITGGYWLSSRCIGITSNSASFRIRFNNNRMVSSTSLFYSDNNEQVGNYGIRPVIILESNVKIDTSVAGKDGSSPENAWVIK